MKVAKEQPTWETCDKCMNYGDNTPFLVEACSSVAIETGQTPWQVAVNLFRNYHDNGHKE